MLGIFIWSMGTKDRCITSKQSGDKRKISLFQTKILPEGHIYYYSASQHNQDTLLLHQKYCRPAGLAQAALHPHDASVQDTPSGWPARPAGVPRSSPPLLIWGERRFSAWNLSNLNSTEEQKHLVLKRVIQTRNIYWFANKKETFLFSYSLQGDQKEIYE